MLGSLVKGIIFSRLQGVNPSFQVHVENGDIATWNTHHRGQAIVDQPICGASLRNFDELIEILSFGKERLVAYVMARGAIGCSLSRVLARESYDLRAQSVEGSNMPDGTLQLLNNSIDAIHEAKGPGIVRHAIFCKRISKP